MMDLKTESVKLDEVLASVAAEWRTQLDEVNAQIAEYDKILAEKESKTDRSENATFQIASDGKSAKMGIKQMLTSKIQSYERHKQEYVPTGVVQEGSTLALSSGNEKLIVKIVPKGLSDALRNLIDVESPVGKASLGLGVSSLFTVKTRKGRVEYKIEGVY